MAATLLSHVVSDLCIGRASVPTLPPSTPVAAALAALRTAADPFVFVDAEPEPEPASACCRRAKTATAVYVRVGVADILCYLCDDAGNNLRNPAAALSRPFAAVAAAAVTAGHGVAHRVDPHTRLMDAIDVLLTDGCQCLLVPLPVHARKRHHQVPFTDAAGAALLGTADFCVVTREDMVRHLFGSISHFSAVAARTVSTLGLVRRDVVHAVHADDDALLDVMIPLLRRAVADGTAVAVLAYDDDALVGEICPAGVLTGKGLDAMAELIERTANDAESLPLSPSSSSTSSDEDSSSPSGMGRAAAQRRRPRRRMSSSSGTSFGWRSTEDVVACHAGSSLVAVMAQALAHRVGYVWVVGETSGALVGVVRFADVLAVLREHLRPRSQVLPC